MQKLKYGLIGYPLGHSMSGVIHRELFRLSGVDAGYDMVEIAPRDIDRVFDIMRGYRGFNVTIPHKINIIPHLDRLSDRAELFGAVNTVDVADDGVTGHNTDCVGFLRALDMADIKLGGRVLLCGSGGVARMIAFESVLAGADLTIAVRPEDISAANVLKSEIEKKTGSSCNVILLSETEGGYDLVVNGTPVGMYPNTDACPVDKAVIQSSRAAFDVIYNPLETRFITYAKEAGLKYSGGLSMLVWQAAVAEEIWNGVKFSHDDIQKVIDITGKELTK
ncbi:MAG: shikimate dehydrogenase [Eubacteriales bacterium]|nr:shikimate dehydrogenase [Eubacteriales bacterium]